MGYDQRITDIAAIAAVAAGKNASVAPQLLSADFTFTLADAVKDGRLILGFPAGDPKALDQRCTEIADQAVPAYRSGKSYYSCTGYIARRWEAAWFGACIALGGNPEDYPDAWRQAYPKVEDPLREALNKIANLGSCGHGNKRVGALFQEAINIAVGAVA